MERATSSHPGLQTQCITITHCYTCATRSHANMRLDTLLGIDRCGQRLADEVRALVAAPENAGLERISFIAHSMGGEWDTVAAGCGGWGRVGGCV